MNENINNYVTQLVLHRQKRSRGEATYPSSLIK